jgi:hypothetical protein
MIFLPSSKAQGSLQAGRSGHLESGKTMRQFFRLLTGFSIALCAAGLAQAQSWSGEGTPWQFQTSTDRVNKAAVNDMLEKKKGGYYDAFHVNNQYSTTIERQVNCTFSPSSSGNASSLGQDASASSPGVSASSGNTAGATGNSNAHSGSLNQGGSVASNQSNTGQLSASVSASTSSNQMAPINAAGGRNQQDASVSQSNSGSQSTTVSASSACAFSAGSALN